jgi:hypothetical protein
MGAATNVAGTTPAAAAMGCGAAGYAKGGAQMPGMLGVTNGPFDSRVIARPQRAFTRVACPSIDFALAWSSPGKSACTEIAAWRAQY